MHACTLSHFSHVQLFMTLWTHSPPGPSVHGILQARILEWVAMASSRGSSQHRDQTQVSCITGRFFTTEPLGKPMRIQYSGFKKAKGSEVTSGL